MKADYKYSGTLFLYFLVVAIVLIGPVITGPTTVYAVVVEEVDQTGFVGYVPDRIVVNFD
jgi:hypothetical protein